MLVSYFSASLNRFIECDEAKKLPPGDLKKLLAELAERNGHKIVWRNDRVCDLLPVIRGVFPWYDAPINDVVDYYFVKYDFADDVSFKIKGNIDFDSYSIAGIFDDSHGYILLLHKNAGGPFSWCVQYAGGGKYFNDFHSAAVYVIYRFNGKLTSDEYNKLMTAVEEHRRTGEPLKYPLSNSASQRLPA